MWTTAAGKIAKQMENVRTLATLRNSGEYASYAVTSKVPLTMTAGKLYGMPVLSQATVDEYGKYLAYQVFVTSEK